MGCADGLRLLTKRPLEEIPTALTLAVSNN